MKLWIEISELNLQQNFAALQAAAGPEITVLAVIKANAYGHSAILSAPILARAGARWIGVTDPAEGLAVRSALTAARLDHQHQPRILIMCGTVMCGTPSDNLASILDAHLTPVVWTTDQIQSLHQLAHASTSPLPVHLEIDTGMARQGVSPGPNLDRILTQLAQSPSLHLEGVLTHFASAEVRGAHQTADQMRRFEIALDTILAASHRPTWIHAGSSSTLNSPNLPIDSPLPWLRNLAARSGAHAMVRSGLALYGYCLPVTESFDQLDQPIAPSRPTLTHQLGPVLTWKTRILSLREIPAGATVGYGATFIAPHPMRLALLPVGYADGLRRELSSTSTRPGGWVIVHGQPAPIVGRISMNLTVVDVTSIPSAVPDDEAILLGPGINADVHARLANTIPYEILCGLRAETTIIGTGPEVVPSVAPAKSSI